jgi:excinuclease ABC subunit A
VIDEPSVNLHPRDYENILKVIKQLKDKQNTIIMVEHNISMIKSSDYILEV